MLPYIDVPFTALAGATSASVDELKLVFSFLFSYPLAGLLKRIPDSKPTQKNLFIIGVGLFYLVGLFNLWSGLRTIFISAGAAYAIAKYLDGPFMPWIGFVFLMGHMSINHIYRQIADDPSSVDVTGAQMVMVMKLTGFCWNVYDGRQPESQLVDFQKSRAIRKLPSLLDYAGYVLFFPSLFAGPAFDYADYCQWIETTMFAVPEGMDSSKAAPTRKQHKIPRSGRPAAWKLVQGLVWVGLFMFLGATYNAAAVLSPDYGHYSFVRRVWLLHMLGFVTRFKYYGVWNLTEGACILTGMGYRGIDPKSGKVQWDRLQNVYPWGIESAQNSRAYLENWNMNTNNWLRNYVYLRVTPKGKKPGFRASLATFTTSAIWHGFYPGYYLTFTFAAFIQTVAKNFRRYVRPFFLTPDGSKPLPSKRIYDVLCWFFTQLTFSFTTAPFVLLELGDCLAVWGAVFFYAILWVAASLAFFASPAKMELIKHLKKRGSGRPMPERVQSSNQPILGMPSDPQRAVQEAADEIAEEIALRRRQGLKSQIPAKEELRELIQLRVEEKIVKAQ